MAIDIQSLVLHITVKIQDIVVLTVFLLKSKMIFVIIRISVRDRTYVYWSLCRIRLKRNDRIRGT